MAQLPGDRLTAAYRRQQVATAAQLAATVRRRFAGVDPAQPATGRNFLDLATQDVVRSNRTAATQAAVYLRAITMLESDTRATSVDLAPAPPIEAIRTSLAVTGLVGLRQRLAGVQSDDGTTRGGEDRATARSKSTAAVMGAAIRHGQDGARDTVIDFVERGRARAFVRVTAMDERVCYFCAVLASRLNYSRDSFEESDDLFDGPGTAKVHDSCVAPGTLVAGPAVEVGTRRWYEGDAILLKTAAGNELTITPNHPVLTTKGWVPAGLLRDGDDLISGRTGQDGLLGIPEVEQHPAAIEDVLAALLMVGGTARVPSTAKHFHGDLSHGEVDVVAPNRLLPDGIDAALAQHGIEGAFSFAGAARPAVSLAGLCAQHHLVLAGHATDGGGMGSRAELEALLRAQGGHALQHGRAAVTTLDPSAPERGGDLPARHTEVGRDGQFGLAGQVARGNGLVVDEGSAMMRFDPASFEFSGQGALAYAELGANLRARLAGAVGSDRIVEASRIQGWASHVYNLQTAEGWYSASGIIVSNCRCHLRPIFTVGVPDETEFYRQKWAELSGAAIDGSNRGALKNFRSQWDKLLREGFPSDTAVA